MDSYKGLGLYGGNLLREKIVGPSLACPIYSRIISGITGPFFEKEYSRIMSGISSLFLVKKRTIREYRIFSGITSLFLVKKRIIREYRIFSQHFRNIACFLSF